MKKSDIRVLVGKQSQEATLLEYDGVADFRAALAPHFSGPQYNFSSARHLWKGGSPEGVKLSARRGRPDLVPAADTFVDRIKLPLAQSKMFENIAAITGPTINVHAAYAGNPLCAISRQRRLANMQPTAIVFDLSVSSGITQQSIATRGFAVLTLARALSATRPVDLYVTCGLKVGGNNTTLFSIKIDCRTTDLGNLAWLVCDSSVLRCGLFALGGQFEKEERHVKWAFDNHGWQVKNLPAWFGERYGLGQDIIIAPGAHVTAGQIKDEASAAEWINKNLLRYGQ